MDAVELLALTLRFASAIQVTYVGSVDAGRLAVAIASRLQIDAEVVVLDGEQLTAEEGESISSALLGGRTIVVADAGGTELSVRLVDTWAAFCDAPQHTSSSADRHIQFSPVPRGVHLGRLVLVSPEGRAVASKADRVWLQADDVSVVVADGSHRDRARRARRLGGPKPAGGQVLRDLCLMHGRDPRGTVRRDLGAALNASDPFTWTDLQTLLRWQTNSAAPLLAGLRHANRLGSDVVQALDAGLLDAASDVRRTANRGRVYSSIWDLMWSQQVGRDHVFRGQWSALWPLTPTLFRPQSDGRPLTVETLRKRVDTTRRFITVLRKHQGDLFGGPPSEDELLAVAQHYGFPTPLLDYTRSLSVAALFATMPARGQLVEPDCVGVIYYLNTDRAELKVDTGAGEDLPGFSMLDAADIRIGLFEVIEPALGAEDDRIGRQSALFLSGFEERDLSSVSIDVMLFEQHAGDVYEDPATAVTEADILPADSVLQRLAEKVKAGRSHALTYPLPPKLAEARLPGAGLPGSTGANLFRQVRAASDFFPRLSAALDDEERPRVGRILSDYFRLAHARAAVGEELASLGHRAADGSPETTPESDAALTPLAIALERLAELFAVDVRRLEQQVHGALGTLDDEYYRGGPPDHESGEAVALAVGLYLASWEKLQHVRGWEASYLASAAQEALPDA
ncbi:FRG domain-containing protein [Terrabacter sp. Root181]|uniref:FRG domain-containing protein n=1 Tax=Terrabacter sp. Root181 TaxID=1736484 RepID=UPI000A98917C|nr:FRG domain-containing protein [Terrabacter sp. Root181]